jgi:hypothetical protein
MKNASIRVNVEKQIPNVGLRLFSESPQSPRTYTRTPSGPTQVQVI